MNDADAPTTLGADELIGYHRPAPCPLRVWLFGRGEPVGRHNPYEEYLDRRRAWQRDRHRSGMEGSLDLHRMTVDEALAATAARIAAGGPAIHGGALAAIETIAGRPCRLLVRPDFIIPEGDGWIVRSVDPAKGFVPAARPDVSQPLALATDLLKRQTGGSPVRAEVACGDGRIVAVPPGPDGQAARTLETIQSIRNLPEEPYAPVGWEWCSPCPFASRCWSRGRERGDVSMLPGLDRRLAVALAESGVRTLTELLARYDEDRLSRFAFPDDDGARRSVGPAAFGLIQHARAHLDRAPVVFMPPDLPLSPFYLVLRTQTDPRPGGDSSRVIAWGLLPAGRSSGQPACVAIGSGQEGERAAWLDFLKRAGGFLASRREIPVLHYGGDEGELLEACRRRFGDSDRIALRLKGQLFDVKRCITDSMALPVSSYSLHLMEQFTGFMRGGSYQARKADAAQLADAIEAVDEEGRERVLATVARHSQQDLEGIWNIFQWMLAQARIE